MTREDDSRDLWFLIWAGTVLGILFVAIVVEETWKAWRPGK